MASTKDVIDNHMSSFMKGNLEGIIADYAEDAVLFMPDGPRKGHDAIRPVFVVLLSEFGKADVSVKTHHESFDGEYAYILWSAETPDNSYELATDTFVVRNGKIIAQSFAAKKTPKR